MAWFAFGTLNFELWTLDFPHGTVFAAGSLQGPRSLPRPTARMRIHIFVPLVKSLSTVEVVVLMSLKAQLVGVTGSTLAWIS